MKTLVVLWHIQEDTHTNDSLLVYRLSFIVCTNKLINSYRPRDVFDFDIVVLADCLISIILY